MITNLWVHPHPIDAQIVSDKSQVFTGVSISIHRSDAEPVTRVIPKGMPDTDLAIVLRNMADELEEA